MTTRAPAWRYHAIHGGRIFQTDADLDALGPDWHDHPDKCGPYVLTAATGAPAPDPREGAWTTPGPSPPVEAEPSSPAPPRRKNRLSRSDEVG